MNEPVFGKSVLVVLFLIQLFIGLLVNHYLAGPASLCGVPCF